MLKLVWIRYQYKTYYTRTELLPEQRHRRDVGKDVRRVLGSILGSHRFCGVNFHWDTLDGEDEKTGVLGLSIKVVQNRHTPHPKFTVF